MGQPLRAILEQRKTWAMSCHKVAPEFDTGDLMAAEEFALHEDESHESLNLKLQIAAGSLARRVAPNFTELWDKATPQGTGEYWPVFSEAERTLDFRTPVATILRTFRAFGNLECYAHLNRERIYVRRALGWPEPHGLRPGSVAHVNGQEVVIAVQEQARGTADATRSAAAHIDPESTVIVTNGDVPLLTA